MKIFAVSDLHLSGSVENKQMDIFGKGWENHFDKIRADWDRKVGCDDVVLIAGDVSWAMKLSEAKSDLDSVCALPGIKVMIKGNHDLWHQSISKTRAVLTNRTYFLQNDSVTFGDVTFVGSRGWKRRSDPDFKTEDEAIYRREIERLRLSLNGTAGRKIALMHYPPFEAGGMASDFTRLFSEYGVETVVYGHIHGPMTRNEDFAERSIDGVRYVLTSCDALGFRLARID